MFLEKYKLLWILYFWEICEQIPKRTENLSIPCDLFRMVKTWPFKWLWTWPPIFGIKFSHGGKFPGNSVEILSPASQTGNVCCTSWCSRGVTTFPGPWFPRFEVSTTSKKNNKQNFGDDVLPIENLMMQQFTCWFPDTYIKYLGWCHTVKHVFCCLRSYRKKIPVSVPVT